jgi:drug/metabolite transporter (DMT)-like permease
MIWLVFALGAAVFLAVKNVWTRSYVRSVGQRAVVLSGFIFTGLCALLYLAVAGMAEVSQAFYWAVLSASLIDVLAVTLLTRAIFVADLSDAYPLVALTPVFTIGTSYFILGETPSLLGISGIVVIVVGSYLLRVERSQESVFEPFRLLFRDAGARYMIVTALLFSLMGPLFKTAMESSSIALTLATGQTLSTFWLCLLYAARGLLRPTIREIRENVWTLAGIGAANFVQAAGTFVAFQLTFVAYAASVKRLGILFTVLFGYIAFKESGALRGALAGAVMLVGVVLISFG